MARPTKAPEAEPTVESPKAPAVPAGFVKVQTTGPFMLVDITTGAHIEADDATVVPDSSFIRERIELKQLKLVG